MQMDRIILKSCEILKEKAFLKPNKKFIDTIIEYKNNGVKE